MSLCCTVSWAARLSAIVFHSHTELGFDEERIKYLNISMINLHFYVALVFDEEIIRMLSIFDAWCIFKMAENQ